MTQNYEESIWCLAKCFSENVEEVIALNEIDSGAEDAALGDPVDINLGTAANPIEVGDLSLHGFEEILLTCPRLEQEED